MVVQDVLACTERFALYRRCCLSGHRIADVSGFREEVRPVSAERERDNAVFGLVVRLSPKLFLLLCKVVNEIHALAVVLISADLRTRHEVHRGLRRRHHARCKRTAIHIEIEPCKVYRRLIRDIPLPEEAVQNACERGSDRDDGRGRTGCDLLLSWRGRFPVR